MVVRILHKVLDTMFREGMASQDGKPPLFSFQRTQAGFLPCRNTYEQASLLHIIQAVHKESYGTRRLLCGIFLDIKKAYDSMEYSHLLDILQTRHRFSKSWLEILRKFLPGNITRIMGREVHLQRGLPQGGALCPFLCDAFMDDLACELAEYIEQHPHLGMLWRQGQDRRGHKWDLKERVESLWLRLLQFADDVAVMAESPEYAQELLDVIGAWGRKRHLEFSSKSFAILLSKPPGYVEPTKSLTVGGVEVPWQDSRQSFRFLGVTTQAACSHDNLRGRQRAALKADKANRCLWALRNIFQVAPKRHYVVPMALRLGIEQVVYAGTLYDTAMVDTDYTRLDKMVMSTVRQVLQVPTTTPTAFLRWELRLWPTQMRADKRSLALAAYLWHHSWIGYEILEHLHDRSIREREEEHPIFDVGLLARLTDILKGYGLSWEHIKQDYECEWEKRDRIRDQVQELVAEAFLQMVTEMAGDTEGMPPHHQQEMIRHMGIPRKPARQGGARPPQPPHLCEDVPLYLFVDGDLPRAGIWMRMPYLRLQFRGAQARASCAWCGQYDGEHGHHLIRCLSMPQRLKERRAVVLKDILEDAKTSKSPPPEGEMYTSPANYDRLFHLYWKGTGEWKKGAKKGPSRRMDAGEQPDREILVKALWFVRALINTYRQATAGTGKSGTNPVWELPVYGTDPYGVRDDPPGGEEAIPQARPRGHAPQGILASTSTPQHDHDDQQEGGRLTAGVRPRDRMADRDRIVTPRRPRLVVPSESLAVLQDAEDEGDEQTESLPRERAAVLPAGMTSRATRGRARERGRGNNRCTSTPSSQRSPSQALGGSNRQQTMNSNRRNPSHQPGRRLRRQPQQHEMSGVASPGHRMDNAGQDRDHGRDGKDTRPRRGDRG
jgi:hypothetical protein